MKRLRYLQDGWDTRVASGLDEPELLRYRSNLLGSDLRITNFGGGNTSSKVKQEDALGSATVEVLWVKGSGGDLGSIQRSGFATLYQEKLLGLQKLYRGMEHEDEMVGYYPLCTFGLNPTAASIDTPLHGLLPYAHIDHLHPDWGIALAASANGKERLVEFNQKYGHKLVWIPWLRPGFELGRLIRDAVQQNPKADGIVLGGHGLFTWGETQRACYENTLTVIDDLGEFVLGHVEKAGDSLFGGAEFTPRADREQLAVELLPALRGRLSAKKKLIAHYSDLPEVLRFVNSRDAAALAHLGTSCPDHFIRTKIRPLLIPWQPGDDGPALLAALDESLVAYRKDYEAYYHKFATPDSPALRDANPTVVLVPGVGMFSFGKSKTEARITGEFYTNAIHVMEGATSLGDGHVPSTLPQAGVAAPSEAFAVHNNYVALPKSEAFRIEYWQLEEAKLRRQPPEKEFARQVVIIVGGANGIGRATAEAAAQRGAHVVIADRDAETAKEAAAHVARSSGKEASHAATVDIRDRASIRHLLEEIVAHFGGFDVLVNTAAMFASSPDGTVSDEQWRTTLDLNVVANHLLVDEARAILAKQNLPASIVLTSSANAVVPKHGSEAYDVSKAALSHLVRELAISLSPNIRVNGISPATVVKGSTMFPPDRVIASLTKYKIAFDPTQSTEELRDLLSQFYAKRTLTHTAIDPDDCAMAILFLASPSARCTTGHLFPVDGGLSEAFLR
ncbi:MAG TPA: bifunctional rhamnulose-1-phosphate aldolase/short-chain dehydrogenase [Verrucomicrobiae bacterium]|nr:bifunctional rhamnulose-1-phosphate aldolase/short-chain dehydrogenase [Verrucomicrobiae bacterium]